MTYPCPDTSKSPQPVIFVNQQPLLCDTLLVTLSLPIGGGFSFPLTHTTLGLGDLFGRHSFGKLVASFSYTSKTLGDGKTDKRVCGNVIPSNALTCNVQHAKVELSRGVSLIGGASVPINGF